MKARIIPIAVAALGCFALSGPALGQQTQEVIVEAPHAVTTGTQTGAFGEKVQTVSIVYKVSYSDLNIATHSGALALQKRVKDAAAQACKQLTKLYPSSYEGQPPCVDGAVASAMKQVDSAIAAAERVAKQ